MYSKFTWGSRRAAIGLLILQLYSNGDLNFPNLELYNLASLTMWGIEFTAPRCIPMLNLIKTWHPPPKKIFFTITHIHKELLPAEMSVNPLLYSTWNAWHKICIRCMINSHVSLFLTFWNNPGLPESSSHPTFKQWHHGGLCYIKFLVDVGNQQLSTSNVALEKFPL